MNDQMTVLIGITGRLGVGKSTLASLIAAEIPDAQVVAFADHLKRQVHAAVAPWLPMALTGMVVDAHKSDIFGPLYQGWGQMMRELVGPNYWINALAERLPDRAIVADVRYPNEAAWIRTRGGLLVAVSGPCRRDGDQRSAAHPSEAQVQQIAPGADIPIVNDYTLDKLKCEARGIARMVLARANGQVSP